MQAMARLEERIVEVRQEREELKEEFRQHRFERSKEMSDRQQELRIAELEDDLEHAVAEG